MLSELNILNLTADTSSTNTSNVIVNSNSRGAIFSLVATNIGTSQIDSLNIKVENGNGSYVTMWTLTPSSPITTNNTFLFMLYPGAANFDSSGFSDLVDGVLPRRFKVVVNRANANAATYKLSSQTLN